MLLTTRVLNYSLLSARGCQAEPQTQLCCLTFDATLLDLRAVFNGFTSNTELRSWQFAISFERPCNTFYIFSKEPR